MHPLHAEQVKYISREASLVRNIQTQSLKVECVQKWYCAKANDYDS